MSTLFDFTVADADGTHTGLARYRGQAVLIVNVASKCGFRPQYAGLEALQQDYQARGFCVLGFPCNQFGGQEPGDAAAIASFCSLTYGVTFPVFGKIEVNGPGANPLYRWLSGAKRGVFGTRRIKWNFTKFLIGRDGQPILRAAPTRAPAKLRQAIEGAL